MSQEEMNGRISQLEAELHKKKQELSAAHAQYAAHFQILESKSAVVCHNEENVLSKQKSLVNKPEVFKGEERDSLNSFIGYMDLYVGEIPEESKLNVAVSFLGGHAFNW